MGHVGDTKKVMYHTFGCKLNFAETASVQTRLEDAGYLTASRGEAPDIIVVNSCSVTEVADKKCRQYIRSVNRRYPDASIVVTGCYAQLKPDEVIALPGVRLVAGTDRKGALPKMIMSLGSDSHDLHITPTEEINEFSASCARGERTRFFLKVQDGCDYRCSYCTIPKARGRSRSPRIVDLVEQARNVVAQGGKEIVLTGVNIGDFGKGTDEKFFDLVRALDEVDGIERYRISSIEPNLLTDEIIEFVATSRRFMPHFHIPLQSGSDAVLGLMRRRYKSGLFAQRVAKIREIMPDAFIGVDVIAGSRGETADLFEESYRFIESLDISRLHVFAYSERPGTDALKIEHKVNPAEQSERVRRLISLSDDKLRSFSRRFIGTERRVLLEHGKGENFLGGFTDNYLRVKTDGCRSLDNRVVAVRLNELDASGEFINASIVNE